MALEKTKEKSGILTWTEDNINVVPNSPGIFVLRSSPINGDVVKIEATDNLKDNLLKIFTEDIYPETKFFEWYTTENQEDAELVKKELDLKYGFVLS